jgi:hypothetical protein
MARNVYRYCSGKKEQEKERKTLLHLSDSRSTSNAAFAGDSKLGELVEHEMTLIRIWLSFHAGNRQFFQLLPGEAMVLSVILYQPALFNKLH